MPLTVRSAPAVMIISGIAPEQCCRSKEKAPYLIIFCETATQPKLMDGGHEQIGKLANWLKGPGSALLCLRPLVTILFLPVLVVVTKPKQAMLY